jgi:hypothetical protein
MWCSVLDVVAQLRANAPPTTVYLERTDPVTRWLAVFGAIVSASAMGWNIVEYALSGPRLRLEVLPDMALAGPGLTQAQREATHVSFRATNRGARPTTLYTYCFLWFETGWDDFYWRCREILGFAPAARRDSSAQAFVVSPATTQPLPHLLNPGAIWMGRADQDADADRLMSTGRLYGYIYHSGGRPARARIRRRVIPMKESQDGGKPSGV